MDRGNEEARERARQRVAARQNARRDFDGVSAGSHSRYSDQYARSVRQRQVDSGSLPRRGRVRSEEPARHGRQVERGVSAHRAMPRRESVGRQSASERPIYAGGSSGGNQVAKAKRYLPFVLIGLIIIVLVFGLGSCVSSCTSPSKQEQQPEQELAVQEQAAPAVPEDYAKIDRDKLVSLIGDATLADQLIARAETDEKSAWIAAHCDDYASLGETQQCKLMKLAAKEASSVDFVRYYLDKVPASGSSATLEAPTDGSVIHLYQWDARWGWNTFSRTVIGTAGCGPTAMAMVYQAMTGKVDLTPYDMAQLAINNDYVHSGTDLGFYYFIANKYGFSCDETSASSSRLKSGLSNGKVYILNVGPGDFTAVGHFIVACGLDSNGKVIINDPYSEVNSSKTWDLDQTVSQTKLMLEFSK